MRRGVTRLGVGLIRKHSVALAVALFCLVGSIAIAAPLVGNFGEPPRLLPYAGILEENGSPVSANVSLTFFLVGDANDGLGDALWTETQEVLVNAGRFSVTLGGITSIPDTVFDRTELYAGVSVAGVELAGLQRVVSTPYAITAANAENFNVRGAFTASGSATFEQSASFQQGFISDVSSEFLGDVQFGNETRIWSDGSMEVGGSGTPYIDFKNDTNVDFDGRLILAGNNLLNVEGARLSTPSGLRLADGNNFDAAPTLDCTCVETEGPVNPIAAVSTAALPAGYLRTGGGCSLSSANLKVFVSEPDGVNAWACVGSLDNGALPNVQVTATATVCGCRLQ